MISESMLNEIYGMVADMNIGEIMSHDSPEAYLRTWRKEMCKRLDSLGEMVCTNKSTFHTDLFIRDKYSGSMHRIGDDVHDCLCVDDEGSVHYRNLQNGDGTIGYQSQNRQTLGEKYPDVDWKNGRENELVYGYEFVTCRKECEYCDENCPFKGFESSNKQ